MGKLFITLSIHHPCDWFSFVTPTKGAGVKQPVHLFFGGKGSGIQPGTSVWVGLPKSTKEGNC